MKDDDNGLSIAIAMMCDNNRIREEQSLQLVSRLKFDLNSEKKEKRIKI